MKFSNISIAALFTILASTAMAAPAADSPDSIVAREPAPVEETYEAPSGLEKRGFGCPGSEKKCHNHCKSVKGYKGGYCDGPYIPFVGRPRCKCY
uniref:Fungal defensin scedosporisin-2 n=1 Tax=Pseudallescheria apiosperma TaxID=563466 RepID=DEFS2_PSEDA|nr:RecName: Full=Fungal defensin scedosporisin-2; Short=fDEF; Flags: Precursor [Scedosporium apiospermum]